MKGSQLKCNTEFKDGQKLWGIYWDMGSLKVGGSVEEIVVVMENGQYADVPWFACYRGGKLVSKWNAALCQGVVYVPYED